MNAVIDLRNMVEMCKLSGETMTIQRVKKHAHVGKSLAFFLPMCDLYISTYMYVYVLWKKGLYIVKSCIGAFKTNRLILICPQNILLHGNLNH